MNLRFKIGLAVVLVMSCVAVYLGYAAVYTYRRIPEAYAAWDTGTLLVEYMNSHERHWPSSWEDLLSLVRKDTEGRITLYGAKAGDVHYAASLSRFVSIDWKFDPSRDEQRSPVRRLDGSKFPVVWAGTEPNERIRLYLQTARTNVQGLNPGPRP